MEVAMDEHIANVREHRQQLQACLERAVEARAMSADAMNTAMAEIDDACERQENCLRDIEGIASVALQCDGAPRWMLQEMDYLGVLLEVHNATLCTIADRVTSDLKENGECF